MSILEADTSGVAVLSLIDICGEAMKNIGYQMKSTRTNSQQLASLTCDLAQMNLTLRNHLEHLQMESTGMGSPLGTLGVTTSSNSIS